jgi:hypothetical protein
MICIRKMCVRMVAAETPAASTTRMGAHPQNTAKPLSPSQGDDSEVGRKDSSRWKRDTCPFSPADTAQEKMYPR